MKKYNKNNLLKNQNYNIQYNCQTNDNIKFKENKQLRIP